MRTRYKAFANNQDTPFFVTSSIVGWIPVFTCAEHFNVVLRCLDHSRKNLGMKLFAFVIMDNHMHLIVSSPNLSKTMQSIKSFTSKQLISSFKNKKTEWLLNELMRNKLAHKTQSTYQIWQEGYHPQLITSREMLVQKADYIHYNPVRRGYVEKPEHWIYSSASSILTGGKGIIELDPLPI